jgi:hypothetical protein
MRGDLLADPQKSLTRWKNYFCQLLNVQGPGGIRRTEIHTTQPYVPEPSAAEVEVAIRKMKRYKAPGSDQIPAELIHAWWKHCILRYINLLCCLEPRRIASPAESIEVPFHKMGDKTDCSNYRGISLLSNSYNILSKLFSLG